MMDFATQVLFGTRLEDKLTAPGKIKAGGSPLVSAPVFPGRPPRLARLGKAEFPRLSELGRPEVRGQVLHFFANHELLALELMALALLRFPGAEPAFRQGLVRTMAEEQEHLKLYLGRMQELGVEFGDLPLSDYFWKAISPAQSPLEFVTQMALTLEQANLDFSWSYQLALERVGDTQTAAILERVYREEIGHVKHGVTWFNRWRPQGESDWEAYLRLLPPPMTPRRAKGSMPGGSSLFAADSRRAAGLSEQFVRELEVFGGSKGRPPVVWSFNPHCDLESARGKPGYNPPAIARRVAEDLEPLLMQLANPQDVVLVHEVPRAEWLRELAAAGFAAPEFRQASAAPRESKLGGIEPWGWSPEAHARFRPWRDLLAPIEGGNATLALDVLGREEFSLGSLFSKSWSVEFLARQPLSGALGGECVGRVLRTWDEAKLCVEQALARGEAVLAKAPFGTSGAQNRRVLSLAELDGGMGAWIRGVIETQGSVVVEPWLDKLADLSAQIFVGADGGCEWIGARRFYVGSQLEYLGTELDPRLTSLGPDLLRFWHGEQCLPQWQALARELARELARAGYRGPAGIDAMLWRDARGSVRFKPLVELNPRWTLGRVALEIERHVVPGTPARFRLVPRRRVTGDFATWAREISGRYPVRLAADRIESGVVWTTDPERAREVVTLLAVDCDPLGDLP